MAIVPAVAGAGSNNQAGGMTYLQLVQRLRQECGVSGTGPNTTNNLTGEMGRLAAWIRSAWMDIQRLHPDWEFMRQPFEFVTQEGKAKYSPSEMLIHSLGSFKRDSLRCYRMESGVHDEQILPFMDYDSFRNYYLLGSSRTIRSRPNCFSIDSQRNVILGHAPDGQYVVTGECYAMPTEFHNDDDMPAMPSQFHMLIVYRAMMNYGQYEAAPEVFQHGFAEYKTMLTRLAADQLPRITFGEPLL